MIPILKLLVVPKPLLLSHDSAFKVLICCKSAINYWNALTLCSICFFLFFQANQDKSHWYLTVIWPSCNFLPFAKTYVQLKFLKRSWLWYCESFSVQTNNSIKVNAAGKLCVCGCLHSAPAHTSDAPSPDWSLMWVAHSAYESSEPVSGLLSWLPGVITRAQEFAGRIVTQHWKGYAQKSPVTVISKHKNVRRESPPNCTNALKSLQSGLWVTMQMHTALSPLWEIPALPRVFI